MIGNGEGAVSVVPYGGGTVNSKPSASGVGVSADTASGVPASIVHGGISIVDVLGIGKASVVSNSEGTVTSKVT